MPRTLGGLVGFVVVSTVTFIVGMYAYNKIVSPLLASVLKKAA